MWIQTGEEVEARELTCSFFLSNYGGMFSRVVRQEVNKNLIKSIEIGDRKVKVNMLQYADNTIFFFVKLTPKMFFL